MKRFFAVSIAMFLVVLVSACEKMDVSERPEALEKEAVTTEEGAEESALAPSTVQVAAATVMVGSTPFTVEIAQSDVERANGLMDRESLPANYGMWFIFPAEGQEKFWMKDTLIALDMIFVDDDLEVVHIIENTVPESIELLSSPEPFRYVLEVNAGTVDKKNIKVGDKVQQRLGSS